MAADDFRCPNCGETIRSTGGAESLYETDTDKNRVVPINLTMFSDVEMDDEIGNLHFCPNQECLVWRLMPLDWDGDT